jgi:hypothetical protein
MWKDNASLEFLTRLNQGFGSVFIRTEHFRLNTDPDPIRDLDPIGSQGFDDKKMKKSFS